MKKAHTFFALFVLALTASAHLGAAPEDTRARIALFEPAGPKADPTLASVLVTVTDTVELSLACLDRYEVRRLPPAEPSTDLEKIRAYCAENRIDQAIAGSANARKEGGYSFRLVVYDRLKDCITLVREGESSGALDMFDVTDALVASLLDGLNGSHLQFGSLEVQSEPAGAAISLNGQEAGVTPVAIRSIPAGRLQIVAKADGWEDGGAPAVIEDGATATVVLKLTRSTGRMDIRVPEDASLTIVGPQQRQSRVGPGVVADLPTGDYEVQARCPGLADAVAHARVERNQVTTCLPWTAGYLVIDSDPAGASIVVDGVEKGSSPGVIEVEPGKLHDVELRMQKFQPTTLQATAAAGTKSIVSAALVAARGSISVETDPSYADVLLDDTVKGQSPCMFGNLTPGEHTIRISDFLKGKRLLTCGPPETVMVQPDDVTVVSRTFRQAMGTLVITGAPKDSTVLVDGVKIGDRAIFAGGIKIPAGVVELSVSGGFFQRWTVTATVPSDVTTVIDIANSARR